MKKRILVISTDKIFCSGLRSKLCSDKNQLSFSESFAKIAGDAGSAQYDLIIADLHQFVTEPIVEGSASECSNSTPIMVMYDELSVEEKVLLYQAGASVLLKKSTAIEICAAQALALIRLKNDDEIRQKSYPLIFGTELMIDPSCRTVKVDGKVMDLTKKEYDLLYCFVQNQRQVLDFEQLYEKVWKESVNLSNYGTVKAHICTLRKKLSHVGKSYIQNIHGVGYRFVPPEY